MSHACGQWVVVRFLFFLVKGQKKYLFQMISSVEYLSEKENLLESSAADNAVASSGLDFFFLLWCFFQSLKQGEMKGRRECVERLGGGVVLVTVEGYLLRLLR